MRLSFCSCFFSLEREDGGVIPFSFFFGPEASCSKGKMRRSPLSRSSYPRVIHIKAFAYRSGVFRRPSRSGSSPRHSRMVRTAPARRCSRSNFSAGVAFNRRRVDFAGEEMSGFERRTGRRRTWPSETVWIWYRALDARRRGRRRVTESGGINIIFYKVCRMEFICHVLGIFVRISRELEVLEAGGEEGGMGPRVEVWVGHGVEAEVGRGRFYKPKTRVRGKTKK